MKTFVSGLAVTFGILLAPESLAVESVAELRDQQRALLLEQEETAESLAEFAKKAFDNGQGDLKELLKAHRELVDVRLRLASTASLRIKELQMYVDTLSEIENKIAAQHIFNPMPGSERYQQIKFANQQAKIALIEEKLRNAPQKVSNRVPNYNELIRAVDGSRD